jgi:carbon starvation protein
VWCLVIYGFLASVLPVWMLLAPRDYLSAFMKIGTIVLLAVGVLVAAPRLQMPATTVFTEGVPGPHDRLRRHADGVIRRRDGADRRMRHRTGPVLRNELPGGLPGDSLQSASEAVAGLGFTITPDQLQAAANEWRSRRWWPGPAVRQPSLSACPRSSPRRSGLA